MPRRCAKRAFVRRARVDAERIKTDIVSSEENERKTVCRPRHFCPGNNITVTAAFHRRPRGRANIFLTESGGGGGETAALCCSPYVLVLNFRSFSPRLLMHRVNLTEAYTRPERSIRRFPFFPGKQNEKKNHPHASSYVPARGGGRTTTKTALVPDDGNVFMAANRTDIRRPRTDVILFGPSPHHLPLVHNRCTSYTARLPSRFQFDPKRE